MLDKNNEVFFGEYCKTCKYKNYSETDCPCSECIAEPVNLYSHKPIRWEGADDVFSGPPPRPDHAYQRAVKYVPERRKDKEKAIARQNIDAEYTGNKVQSIDGEITDDQYPSATAMKKALEDQNEVNAQALAKKIDAPSGCKRGEFLVVEEVNEEGVVKKVRAEEEIDPKLIRDMYYSEIKTLLTWIHDASNYSYVSDVDIQLIAGNRYIVSINGEEYVAIAETRQIGRYDYGVCIGDYISSDLPFWITVPCTGSHDSVGHGKLTATQINADTGTEIKLYEETLHTIKEKYFPKTIFSQGNAPVKFGEGELSTIQGRDTTASGKSSHAEGSETTASGKGSHAEGNGVIASGVYSHAEGAFTESSGDYSHAEGYLTTASGSASHTEGDRTKASGRDSHAEGSDTTASGKGSHAEGLDTVASNAYQSVSGIYNVYDNSKYRYYKKKKPVYVTDSIKYAYNNFTFNNETGQFTVHEPIKCNYDAIPSGKYILWNGILCRILSIVEKTSYHVTYNAIQYILAYTTDIIGDYVHIVGNGNSDDKRSNAYTLDWQGNAWFAGDVYVHSTSGTNKDDGSVRLVTEDLLTYCVRLSIRMRKNGDGMITYSANFPALFVYDEIFKRRPFDAGNSVECCMMPIDPNSPLIVLNYTGMSIDQNSDGNIVLAIRFSSYTSGKQISAEIKDTISGFDTDDENILSTVITVTENALVSYSTTQELTHEQQELAKRNIGAGTLRNVYYWDVKNDTPENPNSVMRCAVYGDTCICLNQAMLPHGMVGPVLVIYGEISYGHRSATAFDGSNATWTFSVNLSDYSYSTPIKKSGIPIPTTAQVGQIVKVKAVDESGKIMETEAVDMPTQKHIKWITVHSSDLTEEKTEIVISTDSNGKTIASYNPIGLMLVLSTPADSTQTDNNGAPWVYPSATYMDYTIRVLGTIAAWKTTARDNVFTFIGGSSAMSCTGNVNTQLATYKIDGYSLDGVKAFLNGTSNHFPIGTHIEVSILCESN